VRKRVGLVALERVPVRDHTELQDKAGQRIGEVTSGLLGPSVDKPVAMGYVGTPNTCSHRHARERHRARQGRAHGSGCHALHTPRYHRG
jgi:glycine cleavage system aminomethyltransferase T